MLKRVQQVQKTWIFPLALLMAFLFFVCGFPITASAAPGDFLYVDPVTFTQAAGSTTRTVGATYEKLYDAVKVADDGDTIVLKADVEVSATIQMGPSGTPRNLTIRSDTGGSYTVTQASGFFDTILAVYQNNSITVSNVIMDGGAVWDASGNNSGRSGVSALIVTTGGCILNQGTILRNTDSDQPGALIQVRDTTGSLLVDGAELYGASSVGGGALLVIDGASAELKNGSIHDNMGIYGPSGSYCLGGGVAVLESSLIMENGFAIYDNHAESKASTTGGFGGAMHLYMSAFTMNGGEIYGNSAGDSGPGYGGAISMNGGTITINGGDIYGNKATTYGGGIYYGGSGSMYGASTLTMTAGKIRDNEADKNGGGIYAMNTRMSVFDVTANILGGEITGNSENAPGTGVSSSAIYALCILHLSTGAEIDGAIHLPDSPMSAPSESVITLVDGSSAGTAKYLISTSLFSNADGRIVVKPGSFTYNSVHYAVTDAEPYAELFRHTRRAVITAAVHNSGGGTPVATGTLVLGSHMIAFDLNKPAAATATPSPSSISPVTANVNDYIVATIGTHVTTDPTLTDYRFKGWSLTQNGAVLQVWDKITSQSPAITTLYAQWAQVYNITVTNDGHGTAAADSAAASAGELITLTPTPNSGYQFKGWQVVSGGPFTITNHTFTMPANAVTVKAEFEPIGSGGGTGTTYFVTYNANGGTGGTAVLGLAQGAKHTIYTASQALVSRDGYTMIGWNTRADGSGAYYAAGQLWSVTGNLTLYGQWKKSDHLLNKDDHLVYISGYPDGTVHIEKSITRAEVATIFYNLLYTRGAASDGKFSDVPASAWYANAVHYLASLEILKGYPDGTFRPNTPITRAEFAAISARFDKLTTGSNAFTDVSAGHWAFRYISSAFVKGWVKGYPDGTFRPENKITRGEVVSVVNRMLDRAIDDAALATVQNPYSDLAQSHWAYREVIEASVAHTYIRRADGTEVWTAWDSK